MARHANFSLSLPATKMNLFVARTERLNSATRNGKSEGDAPLKPPVLSRARALWEAKGEGSRDARELRGVSAACEAMV